MSCLEAFYRKETLNNKIKSIINNHTWELVDLPLGNKSLSYKWILKRNMKVDGSIDRYIDTLVVKGFK
jgi:hypothetical protein